ncbi:MAG TPA: cysteine dioxygenase family protein [Acidimicrobiales bacterium]
MNRTGRLAVARQPRRLAASGRRHVDPAAIARRLGMAVHWPGAAGVRERSWRLVAQARDFDAWLIAWPSGSTADLHDHGRSRGALHVIRGSLVETIPWRDEEGRVTLARREVHAGAALAFGAGHVHDVQNEAEVPALSLHVYSPPLESMNYYERFGDRLVAREKGWVAADDRTSSTDPSLLQLPAP